MSEVLVLPICLFSWGFGHLPNRGPNIHICLNNWTVFLQWKSHSLKDSYQNYMVFKGVDFWVFFGWKSRSLKNSHQYYMVFKGVDFWVFFGWKSHSLKNSHQYYMVFKGVDFWVFLGESLIVLKTLIKITWYSKG